ISATLNYLKVLDLEKDNKIAKRHLKLIRPMVDVYINQLFKRGVQAFEEGNYEQANRAFRAVLSVRRDHAQAQKYLKKVTEYFTRQSEELFLRGLGYYSQKNLKMAIASFREALQYNQENGEARTYLEKVDSEYKRRTHQCDSLLTEARALVKQRDYAGAFDLYEAALELDPYREDAKTEMRRLKPILNRYVDGLIAEGRAAFRRGNLEKARRVFKNVLKFDPRQVEARRYLARIQKEGKKRIQSKYEEGMAYFKEKRWPLAIAAFEAVLEMDSSNKAAKRMLREAYSQSSFEENLNRANEKFAAGKYMEAMELYAHLMERDSSNAFIQERLEACQKQLNLLVEKYFNQGISYYAAERYRDAIREWDKALRINPNHTQALAYKKKAQQRLDALRRLQ
ncbi:MAG: tetratricopeptide repeat protein, partial [Calditrichaeota bacterium]